MNCTPLFIVELFREESLKRDRQLVFLTAVNPMYANQDLEEVHYDLDKPRIVVYLGEFTKIQYIGAI